MQNVGVFRKGISHGTASFSKSSDRTPAAFMIGPCCPRRIPVVPRELKENLWNMCVRGLLVGIKNVSNSLAVKTMLSLAASLRRLTRELVQYECLKR